MEQLKRNMGEFLRIENGEEFSQKQFTCETQKIVNMGQTFVKLYNFLIALHLVTYLSLLMSR